MLEVDKLIIKIVVPFGLKDALHLSCTNFIEFFHVCDVFTMETATLLLYKEVVATTAILVNKFPVSE